MAAWLEYLKGLTLAASPRATIGVGLAVALGLLVFVLLARRSRLMMRPLSRWALIAVTGVTLVALGFAYAELTHTKKEKHLAVALIVDGSASIPDAELARARAWVNQAYGLKGETWTRTLVFSRQPQLLPAAGAAAPAIERPAETIGTNIARALQQSIEMFPEGYTRRVVLLTDGNQTDGDLAAQAQVAAAHGVAVSSVVLNTRADLDAYIESVSAPAAARPGERIKVGAVVTSNFATNARVTLTLAGKSVFTLIAPLVIGRNTFETETVVGNQTAATFTATVEAEGDMHPENNKLSAALHIDSAPRAAMFSNKPDADLPLVEALDSAALRIEPAPESAIPGSAAGLAGYDAVILSDINWRTLPHAQQEALAQYVKDGGGALVIGGENTGDLSKKELDAPIKKMMPVNFKEKKKTEPNPVTLILIIDKSASMGRERKFAMAVLAATETINRLDEKSRIGVILFDDFPRWAVPMQLVGDAANKKKMEDELRTFGVDGGTSLYPAVGEAYKVLKEDKAKVRHIIIMSDGLSTTTFGQWGHLIQWMAAKKITISTVGLGKEADRDHLKKIAAVGQGRFYYTEDFSQIPRIFMEEAKEITKTGIVEKKFTPELLKKGDMLDGLDLSAIPDLVGYNPADAKPTSEVFLTADRGEPLLTRWRFGLGRVTTLCTDSGAGWARSWRTWPQYATVMSRLLKGSLADLALRNYRIEARNEDENGAVKVDATDQYGNFLNDAGLILKVVAPGGDESDVPLSQARPGGYEGRFPLKDYGVYSLRVAPIGGGVHRNQGVGQINLQPPPEFVATQPDRVLLQSVATTTGGKLDPSPAEAFAEPDVEYPLHKPLQPYLLYVALGAMLLALLIRRGILGG